MIQPGLQVAQNEDIMDEASKSFLTGVLFFTIFALLAVVLVLCCPSEHDVPSTDNQGDVFPVWLFTNP